MLNLIIIINDLIKHAYFLVPISNRGLFFSLAVLERYYIQQNDIQHNDTKHNGIQHNDIQNDEIQHCDNQHNYIKTFRKTTRSITLKQY